MRATKPLNSPLREENERRHHPRKGSRILANYQVGGKQYAGYVIDISLGGVCLETCRAHRVGDEITLALGISPKRDEPLNVRGRAVSAKPQGPRRWWVGVQFEELEPDAQEDVAAYMDS